MFDRPLSTYARILFLALTVAFDALLLLGVYETAKFMWHLPEVLL